MKIHEGIAEYMEFHEVMEIEEDMEVQVEEIDEAMEIHENLGLWKLALQEITLFKDDYFI